MKHIELFEEHSMDKRYTNLPTLRKKDLREKPKKEKRNDRKRKNPEFETEKSEIIGGLKSFINDYESFTKKVSPKYWKTTTHHTTELKNILRGIKKLSEAGKIEK